MKNRKKETVSINFEMEKDCNALLTKSVANTKRSKTQEASLRLHDHLKRFPMQAWEEKK